MAMTTIAASRTMMLRTWFGHGRFRKPFLYDDAAVPFSIEHLIPGRRYLQEVNDVTLRPARGPAVNSHTTNR